jgi:hypothetical protein
VPDNDLSSWAGRTLFGAVDLANDLTGRLLSKGVGVLIGGEAYKCTECAYVRLIGPDGKEKFGS